MVVDRTKQAIDPDETISSDGASRQATEGHGLRAERGALIGRYVVLGKLGAGAMGVVLAAYDPELDRRVALKLLEPRGDDRGAAQARLQREAQALAKLSHQNVVGVHDVGVHRGQVFLAMEYVEGETLRTWMGAGGRSWPEIVRIFEAAGSGLAAAHSQGLTHRDFKPVKSTALMAT